MSRLQKTVVAKDRRRASVIGGAEVEGEEAMAGKQVLAEVERDVAGQ